MNKEEDIAEALDLLITLAQINGHRVGELETDRDSSWLSCVQCSDMAYEIFGDDSIEVMSAPLRACKGGTRLRNGEYRAMAKKLNEQFNVNIFHG